MTELASFPPLQGWEPTRDTLHGYAQAISAVPRALAEPHPKWWHISLKLQPDGPATDRIPFPGEPPRSFQILLNLRAHTAELHAGQGAPRQVGLDAGLTTSALGDWLLEELAELGLRVSVERKRFENDEPRAYDREHAAAYHQALAAANDVLRAHRDRISADASPVQLWPHNFDLAFDLFGTRLIYYEEPDGIRQIPARVNFGFAPGDSSHPAPYFYSNPWPFEQRLVDEQLPEGARWFTEGWNGTLLPYSALIGQPVEKLQSYYQAVYRLARPLINE